MTRTRALATGVSLLLGAVAGGVAGVRGGAPAPTPSAPRCCDRPSPAPSTGTRARTSPAPLGSSVLRVEPARTELVAASAGASAASAAPRVASGVPRPSIDLAPPTTKGELVSTETRCAREVPEDCERAARALDLGQILPRDADRAKRLQRVALTLYVRQCERGSRALACARLAEMHEKGETVFKNPATARALWSRFQELCARKPDQAGCTSPSSG